MKEVTSTHKPKGFNGSNFMTPEIIGYYKRQLRGRVAYVEISHGRGIFSDDIYGVTFRWADGTELWRDNGDDPSQCFQSHTEAMEYAETVE